MPGGEPSLLETSCPGFTPFNLSTTPNSGHPPKPSVQEVRGLRPLPGLANQSAASRDGLRAGSAPPCPGARRGQRRLWPGGSGSQSGWASLSWAPAVTPPCPASRRLRGPRLLPSPRCCLCGRLSTLTICFPFTDESPMTVPRTPREPPNLKSSRPLSSSDPPRPFYQGKQPIPWA